MLTTRILAAACLIFPAVFAQDQPRPATPPQLPASAQPPTPATGPVVVSPEVAPDRRITFRILAPQAQTVTLRASDIPQLATPDAKAPFTKGENGVWEATVGPVIPGAYRYTFVVDGVAVVDPRNPQYSQSN